MTDAEKVKIYEHFLHTLQLYAEITMEGDKVQKLIANACNWSYAHRRGNGEFSEEEQAALVEAALLQLPYINKR